MICQDVVDQDRAERLYEKYHKLAFWMAKKKIRRNKFLALYESEMYDAAVDGLLSVIRSDKFDEDSKTAKSYISTSIIRSLFLATGKAIKSIRQLDHFLPLDEMIKLGEKCEFLKAESSSDYNYSNKCKFAKRQNVEFGKKIIEVTAPRNTNGMGKLEKQTILTNHESFVIDQIYYQDQTQADIERSTDLTKQYIYQLHNSALRKLKMAKSTV